MNGCEFQQSNTEAPAMAQTSTSSLPRAPIPGWQLRQFEHLLDKLSEWRNDDHEDAIVLCRSEIIAILEGVKACQNRPVVVLPKG
jgi:hypothetical protein